MVSYELYFKSGNCESITKYKFKDKNEALLQAIHLNAGLQINGHTDREYIVYKVTRELLK